jgi:Cu/Ag efflux pump CusA
MPDMWFTPARGSTTRGVVVMRRIVESSLRLTALVLVAVGIIFVAGAVSLRDAPVDTLPEYLPPHVLVQTEALGLSAAEIEEFITVTLEDDFNGLAFLDHLRSKSVPGLSSIQLTLKPGTDLYKARQLLTERVPVVRVNVGTPPVMIQPMSSQSRLMMVGLSSSTVPLVDISTLARWRIKPRLLAVPGVANVTIWGQRDQQLQVLVNPKRMAEKGVTLDQVISTTGDALWTSPLTFVEASSPGADGLIDTPNQRLTVQHVLPIRSAQDLAAIPIDDTKNPQPTLGDVATVVEDHPALRGDAVLKDGPGFILVVEKSPGADTLVVTREVERAVASLKPGLTGITVDATLFRSATFIETAMRNIGLAVLAGFLLVVAWMGIASRSWRTAVVGAIAVALSFTVAALVLYALGTGFNAMTLAGLVIALGVIVDDAVVAVTSVKRRLQERGDPDDAESATTVIADAFVDARRPLGYALAILFVMAGPLLLLEGTAGAFARPMVVAYMLAMVASAATALVVSPVLARLLTAAPAAQPGRLERRTERVVERVVSALARRPVWTYGVAAVFVVAAAVALTQASSSFSVPEMRDRNLLVQWEAAPGTSLAEMDRMVVAAGAAMRSIPGVRGVGSHVGQALAGDRVVDVDSGDTWITLDPSADYDKTTAAIRLTLAGYAGLRHTLQTYAGRSLDDAQMNNGKAVTVRLYGNDQQVLETEAARARDWLSKVPGIVNAQVVVSKAKEPVVQIRTDAAAAARYGLKPGDVRRQTAVLVGGVPVASYYHDQQIFDVSVWSEPSIRANVADIENLPLDSPQAGRIPLKAVARVSVEPALTEIDRDMASRYVDITADAGGDGAGSVVSRVREGLLGFALPLGYRADVFSALQDQRSIDDRILLYVLVAALGAFLLLQTAFESWSRAILVFVTLPLAVCGGAVAALADGGLLTLGALVGLMAVFGVAVRNEIALVRRCEELERSHVDTPRIDLVVRAAREAAFPVLLTASCAALAVLPLVAAGNVEGMEILRPLGLAVIGGLVTSTAFTLLVLPALYVTVGLRAPSAAWDPGTEGTGDETP